MDLKWPLLLLPIAAAIGVAVWYAMKHTRSGWQVELPYLARSYRLTTLPEYQRALRLHERISVAALVLAVVAVFMLIGATVRPAKTYEPNLAGSDTPHVDIMLCFAPLYSIALSDGFAIGQLMTILREKVDGFGNQRIGMTKEFYRSIPVTSDLPWVSNRLGEIAKIAEAAWSNKNTAERYQADGGLFDRYSATRSTINDTIAMCAMGLPAVGSDNGRGRAIVYIGDTKSYDDTPPTYSDAMLARIIKDSNIQLNTIVPGTRTGEFVDKLVKDSGGRQYLYTQVGGYLEDPTPKKTANQNEELANAVDKILSNPPPSTLDGGRKEEQHRFQWDVPDILLQIALIAAVALAAARLGMRL